jgi:dimethylhistidine N-methyltransferase
MGFFASSGRHVLSRIEGSRSQSSAAVQAWEDDESDPGTARLPGVRWLDTGRIAPPPSLAAAVRHGLTRRPKTLPSHFFYDTKGSKLFESICDLPEYYLTRAETRILEAASEPLAEKLPEIRTLVELGSGSAVKTELLLQSFSKDRDLSYVPIDVSKSALEESVERIAEQHPDLTLLPAVAEYESGLAAIQSIDLGPRLFLWLGSSIGNLRPAQAAGFLARCREKMNPGDHLLVGIDLRKDRQRLEDAYNDSQGVTAQFNLNLLERLNRELDAEFDLERFHHRVHYDEGSGSVQSFLESQTAQVIPVGSLDLEIEFEPGERIHTEDSFKYSVEEIDALASQAGLRVADQFFDGRGETRHFSVTLFGLP